MVKIIQWIRANRLSLNLKKTKYILFSNSIDSLPGDILFDNSPLEKVTHSKFLGVTIDNKLSWKIHIDNISKKVSRNIGILNRLKFQLPFSSLHTLYSSLVLPYLNYGLLAWGNAHQTILDKLLLLQKKAIRIICQAGFRTHTDPLFYEKKILKIKDLYFFQLGQFMYNYTCDLLPDIFKSMFLKNRSFHQYPTRKSDDYHLPLLRSFFAQNTFIYEGPKFWNSLTDSLKNAPSLNTFKNKLKLYLLSAYNKN